MSIRNNYKATIFTCCVAYIVQAAVCNFAPLLFLTFINDYGIPLSQLTLLITINFAVQFTTDLLSSKIVPLFGYRKSAVAAHVFCAVGLLSFSVLPFVIQPFAGLLISVCIFAVGGGLLEVLISPIVEACPTQNKAGFMSLLHSFYCWGVVLSVGLSTLFFVLCGTDKWPILSALWAILPLCNIFLFLLVPIYPVGDEGSGNGTKGYASLFRQKNFWLMLVFMLCAGASELAVAQWASAFTESALHVSKTMGDLIGVCGFSFMMGVARLLYAKLDTKIPIKTAMTVCALLCIAGYLMIGLTDSAVWGLIGCAVCGFAVGIFWPASFSMATVRVHNGGTAMFAFLALAGDIGCTSGPSLVGAVSDFLGDDLRLGIFAATVFPIVLLAALCVLHIAERKKRRK